MFRWIAAGVAAVIAHSAFAVEASAKPVQWKKSQGDNNHWYEAIFVPAGVNWVEAHLRATARGCGWHLATITSKSEDKFVFGLIANREEFFVIAAEPIHGPWLGGFQRNATDEPAGQWRWVTNERFSYTNWGEGEPNSAFGGPFEIAPGLPDGNSEDFLHYKRIVNKSRRDLAFWNDMSGNVLLPGYLVEFEFPRPTSCSDW